MANTCAYCNKELKRLIFCDDSHRSMYYRKKIIDTTEEAKEQIKTIKVNPEIIDPPKEKHFSPMLNRWI